MNHETDVVVVGAGPVGLFTVFECGMVKLHCHVVDALDAVGGQCQALYPEKPIYDIPGHPRILGSELVDKLRAQAEPFEPVFHLGRQMVALDRDGSHWRCVLADGTTLRSRAVIVAAGCGAFGPNRPPLDGLEAFEGTSVFYFVARREDFRGKRVVIAGGGDSAVDWAVSLAEIAAKVMVVHRRPKFRAAPLAEAKLLALAATDAVELVVPYQLHGLHGHDGRLDSVTVATLDGQTRRLEADVLLPFFGMAMELGPITGWGLAMDGGRVGVDPATMATDTPGVFAVGDICDYPGKLKLILSGFAEAARAAHSAHAHIHPEAALHFEYSTTSGVPGK